MKKTFRFQVICLLTIGLLACSSNTPSDTIKAWYDCAERSNADCLLNHSSDEFIERFGGSNAFKETWEATFKKKKKVTYIIDEENSTGNTAEVKVSVEIYENSNNEPYKGKALWKLEKNRNGSWKVKDWIPLDSESQ
jgi:ketosteroid isomerase-like protein